MKPVLKIIGDFYELSTRAITGKNSKNIACDVIVGT